MDSSLCHRTNIPWQCRGVLSFFGKNMTNFAFLCATTMAGIPNQSDWKGLLSSVPDFQLCFLGRAPFFSCRHPGSPRLLEAFAFNEISQLRVLIGSSTLNIFAGPKQLCQAASSDFMLVMNFEHSLNQSPASADAPQDLAESSGCFSHSHTMPSLVPEPKLKR